jgi:hypothetical protein
LFFYLFHKYSWILLVSLNSSEEPFCPLYLFARYTFLPAVPFKISKLFFLQTLQISNNWTVKTTVLSPKRTSVGSW